MKKTGLFAASAAAAALSAPPSPAGFPKTSLSQQQEKKMRDEEIKVSASRRSDQFAPRFDGLRFIETLVTAHR